MPAFSKAAGCGGRYVPVGRCPAADRAGRRDWRPTALPWRRSRKRKPGAKAARARKGDRLALRPVAHRKRIVTASVFFKKFLQTIKRTSKRENLGVLFPYHCHRCSDSRTMIAMKAIKMRRGMTGVGLLSPFLRCSFRFARPLTTKLGSATGGGRPTIYSPPLLKNGKNPLCHLYYNRGKLQVQRAFL